MADMETFRSGRDGFGIAEPPFYVHTMDKYPRTPHLPFSPGVGDDDESLESYSNFFSPTNKAEELVLTEKLDGGNCCLKDGQVFARTHSKPASHASFSMVKQLYHSMIMPLAGGLGEEGYQESWELYGENMEATHSIDYTPEPQPGGSNQVRHSLPSPFFLFAVFDRAVGMWLSWDEVEAAAVSLGIPSVPVVYRGTSGIHTEAELKKRIDAAIAGGSLIGPSPPPAAAAAVPSGGANSTTTATAAAAASPSSSTSVVPMEGCVLRVASRIHPTAFPTSVAKWVRKGHIQTDDTFSWSWKQAHVVML